MDKKKNLGMEPRLSVIKLSIIFVAFFLGACSKKISPETPLEEYGTTDRDVFKKEISYINVPLNLKIANIERQINAEFKGLIYEDNSFEGDDLKLKIWKQKDIRFSSKINGVFSFEVPLKIWVEKRVSVLGMSQTPGTEFEIIAKFSSKPFISANWELKTVTNSDGFEWITEPKIRLGGFNVPIAGIVGSFLNNYQGTIARMIDESVADQIDIKTPVLDVWNKLKMPMQVNAEYNIWTQIEPQDILMTELISNTHNIQTAVAIKAVINSSVGQIDKPVTISKELPPIKFVTDLPKGFGVYLYNLVTFREAEKMVNQFFKGEKYKFSGGREITINEAKIFGGKNNKLIIEIQTSGDLNGTIYLKGDPVYDLKKRQLVMTNTDFDLKTKNILKKAASWVIAGNLERTIEKEFGIAVDPILEIAKSSVDEIFKSNTIKGVKLSGGIKEINPVGVKLQKEGLMTIVEIKGDLDVKL